MSGPLICLASRSPRRRALLEQIGVAHRVVPVDVAESRRPGEPVQDYVQRLALEKARAGAERTPGRVGLPVLGADTVVVIDGRVLGKPAGRDEALAMLALLSGRAHEVLTGVALVARRAALRLSVSQVWFRSLSAAERAAYWETGEPSGKAGAYAIQGHAGAFIARLEGSYSGVMGLPLYETAELLRGFSIPVFGAG